MTDNHLYAYAVEDLRFARHHTAESVDGDKTEYIDHEALYFWLETIPDMPISEEKKKAICEHLSKHKIEMEAVEVAVKEELEKPEEKTEEPTVAEEVVPPVNTEIPAVDIKFDDDLLKATEKHIQTYPNGITADPIPNGIWIIPTVTSAPVDNIITITCTSTQPEGQAACVSNTDNMTFATTELPNTVTPVQNTETVVPVAGPPVPEPAPILENTVILNE